MAGRVVNGKKNDKKWMADGLKSINRVSRDVVGREL